MGKKFSYEAFCKYIKNKMSYIIEGEDGEFMIVEDTQPLEVFGLMTEEETLRYIYDNNLFDELQEVFTKNEPYI